MELDRRMMRLPPGRCATTVMIELASLCWLPQEIRRQE